MENNNRTLKELATLDMLYQLGASNIHSWSWLNHTRLNLDLYICCLSEDPHKHLKEFHMECSTMRP
ncbi:hypothetical protein CR513_39544, partial [Mucuna pruriens]